MKEWMVSLVWPCTTLEDWNHGNDLVKEVEDEFKPFDRDDYEYGGSGTGFGMRDVDWHFSTREGAEALHGALLHKFTSKWIEMVKHDEFSVSFFEKEPEDDLSFLTETEEEEEEVENAQAY